MMKAFFAIFKKILTKEYNPRKLRKALASQEWRNDYNNENMMLHIEAACLLGLGTRIYLWRDLAEAFSLEPDADLPMIQNALANRIESDLGVEHLPAEERHVMHPPNWHGIAWKLGVSQLKDHVDSVLPIPFIIYAFIDYKKRHR